MTNCIVKDCENKKTKKEYCNRHYIQFNRYGKILERTKFDKNEITKFDNYCEISLYDIKNKEVARTKIDKIYLSRIKKYKWCLSGRGYVTSKDFDGRNIFLHRFIIGWKDNMVTDHINGDKLDNRKNNLRIITQHKNSMNSRTPISNTSGIKGVRIRKDTGKWVAEIKFNYKSINLGSFDSIEKAIKARRAAEIKYFGKYRNKE